MNSVEEFKALCAARNIPYNTTPNAWHFTVEVNGNTYNIWPTKDKYAPVHGLGSASRAEEFLRRHFPEITSYLSHYLTQNPDKSWSFILYDSSVSTPYPTRDECLFEFGKYCLSLDQAAATKSD